MFSVGLRQLARSVREGTNPFKPVDVISTRPAGFRDNEFIRHLRSGTLHEYTDRVRTTDASTREVMLSNPCTGRDIVLCNDKMIGYRSVSRDFHMQTPVNPYSFIFLNSLIISPEYQRRGIGTLLINEVIQKAAQEGLPVALHVLDNKLDAQRLYLRLGFEINPVRTELNLLLMTRRTGPPAPQAKQNQNLLFNA
jgi:ribosomal protein S18 acetylase RimI-like enzyme